MNNCSTSNKMTLDYGTWIEEHQFPEDETDLQSLVEESASWALYFARRFTAERLPNFSAISMVLRVSQRDTKAAEPQVN